MYYLYQNRYANKLHLNIIRVRYADKYEIQDKDFSIKLENNVDSANDLITYKLYLYLGCLLTKNALNDEILIVDTKVVQSALNVLKKAYIIASLDYLQQLRLKYYYFKRKRNGKGYDTEIKSCKVIDYYTCSKGSITIKFDKAYLELLGHNTLTLQIPNAVFSMDINTHHLDLFIAFRLLLHRQVNYNKNKDVISVKEIFKYCSTLPTYDELNKYKQVSRNIISPFINNMNYVCETLDIH